MSSNEVRKIGGEQIPYFRTPDFSKIVLENENLLKSFFKAEKNSRVVFMTGSGTASMEASIINTLNKTDNVLIVNGGSFGHRFCEICATYEIPFTEIKCVPGENITATQLDNIDGTKYTAFLVNLDETSTGVLYDIQLISDFCKKYNLFLIVDSISSFLCDEFNMEKLGVNVVITGSQKALALAPGLSLICLDSKALRKVNEAKIPCYYFDLKKYLSNGERGQTPFTPAVGIILQLNQRLRDIQNKGGVDAEIRTTQSRALYFRNAIKGLPFKIFSNYLSNAVTSLCLENDTISAYSVFEILLKEYNIFVCPNGGEFKDKIFRVGHIGDLTFKDYDTLIEALTDLQRRKLI